MTMQMPIDFDRRDDRPRRRLCIIASQGVSNPATRLRALQYIPDLERLGYDVDTFFIPFAHGSRLSRMRALWNAVRSADVIFVQRVLRGWLNIMLRASGRPVVFDVDDAVHYIRQSQFASARDPKTLGDRLTNTYRRIVRGDRYFSSRRRPLEQMLRLASAIVAGNRVLHDDVVARTKRVVVLPTAVPVETFEQRRHVEHSPVRIGWIGVASNVFHLDLLDEAFRSLAARYGDGVELVVVSNRAFENDAIATTFIEWSLEKESHEVAQFDIGIMPLQDDFFSRGKCSFKAIYCMAHGVPVVISPVGMNTELVRHGIDGFLADSTDEWIEALASLIDDVTLRARMGAAARVRIEEQYGSRMVFDGLVAILDELSE